MSLKTKLYGLLNRVVTRAGLIPQTPALPFRFDPETQTLTVTGSLTLHVQGSLLLVSDQHTLLNTGGQLHLNSPVDPHTRTPLTQQVAPPRRLKKPGKPKLPHKRGAACHH